MFGSFGEAAGHYDDRYRIRCNPQPTRPYLLSTQRPILALQNNASCFLDHLGSPFYLEYSIDASAAKADLEIPDIVGLRVKD